MPDLSSQLTMAWIFGLTILIRSSFHIRKKMEILYALGALGGGVLCAIRITKGIDFNDPKFLVLCFTFYILVFTAFMFKNILPTINEKLILGFSLLFLYFFCKHLLILNPVMYPLIGFVVLNIAAIIFLAFKYWKLPFWAEVYFYALFLIMNMFFTFLLMGSSEYSVLEAIRGSFKNPYQALVLGGSMFYVISNLTFIGLFIPWKGKSETWESAKQRWLEYLQTVAIKHSDNQLSQLESFIIIFGLGLFLVFNYFSGLISDSTLLISGLFIIDIISKLEYSFSKTVQNPANMQTTK